MLEVSRRRAQPIKSFFKSPTRKPALQMQGSAQGHFQTSSRVPARSVDPSTADMRRLRRPVGLVPLSDSCIAAITSLFDHFVGSEEDRLRHREP